MKRSNTIAFSAFGVGIVLLYFAWLGSNAPVDQMTGAMGSPFAGTTMWLMLAGIGGVLAGGAGFMRGILIG